MIDDGLEPVEVTGRWVGFYRHRWEQLGTYPRATASLFPEFLGVFYSY